VPVAAARLADIGAADADPRVALRGGEHVGEKFAVRLLDEGAIGERAVGLGEAGRERVADLLQLTEIEDTRRAGGIDPVRDVDPAEPFDDQPGELALELADLPAQLRAREPLAKRPRVPGSPLGDQGQPVDLTPVEQIRHSQILSRFEGRGGNP
jgi:hypothetical protein